MYRKIFKFLWLTISLLALLIISVGLLFSGNAHSQVCVEKDYYYVLYDTVRLQPLEVSYIVSNKETSFKRRGRFYTESFPTSSGKHYKNSIYDRGHLVSSKTLSFDTNAMQSSYSYANVVLQNKYLNKGVWKTLEEVERRSSKQTSVHVIVYVYFDSKPDKFRGVEIPDGFIKVISFGDTQKIYYFPNEKPKSMNLKDYELCQE